MHRFRSVLHLIVWLVCTTLAAAQGSVVSIGGALRDDNLEVWRRIVQLAGGAGAPFAVFGTASQDPDASTGANVALLRQYGATAVAVRVAPRIPGIDLEAAVRDPHWIALVRNAKGIYFGGGDQSRIVATLAPGGVASPLLLAIRDVLRDGGVVAGSSAGAAVMSELMFTGGEPLAVMKNSAGTVHDAGLGFIKPGVLIDQHFLKRGRIGRLLPLMQRQGIALGIGVEEDSAIVVQGDEVEVIGRKGALMVDLSAATSDPAVAEFNLRGARLSYLDRGDRVHLASRVVTPSPAKLAGRRLPAGVQPRLEGAAFFADVLADFAIVNAMVRLVDSTLAEVRGLSFDALATLATAREDKPELGFEWRLTRGADTSAWSAGDDFSIVAVHLDVQPVRMKLPLYTPWR